LLKVTALLFVNSILSFDHHSNVGVKRLSQSEATAGDIGNIVNKHPSFDSRRRRRHHHHHHRRRRRISLFVDTESMVFAGRHRQENARATRSKAIRFRFVVHRFGWANCETNRICCVCRLCGAIK
jgi:hypothetical protein